MVIWMTEGLKTSWIQEMKSTVGSWANQPSIILRCPTSVDFKKSLVVKRTATTKWGQVSTGDPFTSQNDVKDTVSLVAKRNTVRRLAAKSDSSPGIALQRNNRDRRYETCEKRSGVCPQGAMGCWARSHGWPGAKWISSIVWKFSSHCIKWRAINSDQFIYQQANVKRSIWSWNNGLEWCGFESRKGWEKPKQYLHPYTNDHMSGRILVQDSSPRLKVRWVKSLH